MTDDLKRRQGLTFSQAEGLEALPGPLNLGEVPQAFRVQVWSMLYKIMPADAFSMSQSEFRHPSSQAIAEMLWLVYFKKPIDEFPAAHRFMDSIKSVIMQGPYNRVFDLLTELLQNDNCPHEMRQFIAGLLRMNQMAYSLDTSGPPIFIPHSSPQEGEAVRAAMGVLAESGMDGARTHLLKAAEAINHGNHADAVRESIHAVESVAKVISGGAKKTLAPALMELEKRGLLPHKALATGFGNLYGYTNDEKGIRHSLLEKGDANVGQEEAVFMFGACASFCGYLCRKQAKIPA